MTDAETTSTFAARIDLLEKALAQLESLAPEQAELLQRWCQTLAAVRELRLNFSLPVTCIGPVKSGKSTLINTLAGADLLPTGAGITTSFPTTLSAGQEFAARIKLQPEAGVNDMFIRAANLLLSDELKNSEPDLFVEEERLQVKNLLSHYQFTGNLTRHGIFNESYRLLKNMTVGAEKVSRFYHNSELEFTFTDPEDSDYRDFIRDETLSPFLSGINLKAPLRLLPQHLSLRDLPGLDTPNPSHQNIIIQQLSESPALIYVISSRIGLRQADYQLLEHLHQLGLKERLLFVINLDLDVHNDAEEVKAMTRRCRDELDELSFTQDKYAFSALALFWSREEIAAELVPSARRRLQAWQDEQEKLEFSNLGARQFLERLRDLGRNDAGSALLNHSNKRLQQVYNNTRRLIENELGRLEQNDASLNSDLDRRDKERRKIESVFNETGRIITGVCNEIEKAAYNEITRWLDRNDASSLRRKLEKIIADYQAPLDQLPEKNRNPLTPMRIIDNHFQLTVPARIQETATLGTLRFLETLHNDINQRLLKGCAPLFIICENFVKSGELDQSELPLPIKISGEIPLFKLSSEAEERFAIVDKISNLMQLMGRKILRLRRRRSLGEEYNRQIKKAALKELPRWLRNYREQLKFALVRHHIDECRDLTTNFFSDLLASTRTSLEQHEQLSDADRADADRRITALKEIAGGLQEAFKTDE